MENSENISAFPISCGEFPIGSARYPKKAQKGMSLRDYFADAALQTMGMAVYQSDGIFDLIAKRAYEIADAMIKERNKDKNTET